MHKPFRNSLSEYAARRYRLAGSKLVESGSPFFRVSTPTAAGPADASAPAPISFAHYDYLGLGVDPAVRQAAAEAALALGTSVGASRLVGGERDYHAQLEGGLAAFLGTEAALSMVSGYATNTSVISHVMMSDDVIFYDEFSHNSIVAGTRGTRATSIPYDHNSIEHLEQLMHSARGAYKRALVVTEGLFSMDGDIPDLPRLLDVCRAHEAWLMLDEAHSIGVLGRTGRGLTEHFGIDAGEIDLIVGTMSKAFASCGGFICASQNVIDWLRYTLPGFVFSVGLTPGAGAAVMTALDLLRSQPERVERVNAMSRHFVTLAGENGLDVGPAIGAGVVPVILPDNAQTLSASEFLRARGIFVPPIFHVGVPKEQPRLRFFITASHTRTDIERAIDALVQWRETGGMQAAEG